MSTLCKNCGMPSDKPDVCTWCGKPLAVRQPAGQQPVAPAPQPPGAPGPVGAPGQPVAPPPPGAAAAAQRPSATVAARQRPTWPYYVMATIGVLLLAGAANFIVWLTACKPPDEPQNWQQAVSKTKHFSLEVPEGWAFTTSGSEGTYERATVRRGSLYRVTLHGNQALGAVGDIAGAAARVSAGEMGPAVQTVEERAEGRLHSFLGEVIQKEDKNYREEGAMREYTFAGSRAAISTYTTKKRVGLIPVTVKGWRITVAGGGDYSYDVRADCPASHWNEFEPVAERILGGVTRGGA